VEESFKGYLAATYEEEKLLIQSGLWKRNIAR